MRTTREKRVAFAGAVSLSLSLGACHRTMLPPRPDGDAVVVTTDAPSAEGDVPLVAEAEPNDTLATAQRLGLGAWLATGVAATLHGVQGKTRDSDLFRLDIPAPDLAAAPAPFPGADASAAPLLRRVLRVDARPEVALGLSLEALDDQGQPLAVTGAAAAGEPVALPNLAVTQGTYYLRVRATAGTGVVAGNGGGSYHLVAHLGPLEAGAELEPNGKAAMATELAVPGEAVGYFGWRHDQDWYRIATAGLADGSVLGADLEPAPGVTASLLVFDSVEQKLTEAHGRKEERVALRSVRVPTGEPYVYVVVRADAGANVDVRYNLRVRAELPKAGGEVEPNDDPAHAQAVPDVGEGGAATVAGYLGRGDVDVYRYVAPTPVELDVEAVPPERVDLKLEILRPDGTVLSRSDTGKRREAERLPNVYVAGGSALIRLSGGKGDGNSDEPYRLSIAAHPPEPGAEREPDDTIATPTLLPPGAVGNGLIAPRGDVDFWQATATADADGNVPVTVTGIAGLTLDVRVRGGAGKEIERFKAGAGPTTTPVATGGDTCCLLEVREASGKLTNPRDRYQVTVGK
jgi:hypothetical protein